MTKREYRLVDTLMQTPKKNWEKLYHCTSWYSSVYRLEKGGYDVCISYKTAIALKTPKGEFVRLWSGYSKTSMGHLNYWCSKVGMPQFTGKLWMKLKVGKKYSTDKLEKMAKKD